MTGKEERTMKRLAIAATAAFLAAMQLSALTISKGEVKRGQWNLNVKEVFEAAKRDGAPMVLFLSRPSEACIYCTRLKKVMEGEAFRIWCEDRKPYLAYMNVKGKLDRKSFAAELLDTALKEQGEWNLKGYPQLIVTYTDPDGKVSRYAFMGRRGLMKVGKYQEVIEELLTALDKPLAGYLAAGEHKSIKDMMSATAKKVEVKVDGAGSVSIDPADGFLHDGGTVTAIATPNDGNVFYMWRDPDGEIASWNKRLVVKDDMKPGTYTAVFKDASTIKPPIVDFPAETQLVVRVDEPMRIRIPVSDESRPVLFSTDKDLPESLFLSGLGGLLWGSPDERGNYEIEVSVTGSDPAKTVVKRKITLVVKGETYGGEVSKPSEDVNSSSGDPDEGVSL